MSLEEQFSQQKFPNGYEFVDGVKMHRENGDQFHIPHPVLKKHILVDFFVELRVDSPRFSVHEDAPEKCTCSHCNGEATKPILRHDHPASLLPLPDQKVPSRGWGEDFWVQVSSREGDWFSGRVDNPLIESRLHQIHLNDEIVFHVDHVLAVHSVHRQDMVSGMDENDLKELAKWLGTQRL